MLGMGMQGVTGIYIYCRVTEIVYTGICLINVLKLLIVSEMLTGDGVGSSPGEPGRCRTPSSQLRPAAVS